MRAPGLAIRIDRKKAAVKAQPVRECRAMLAQASDTQQTAQSVRRQTILVYATISFERMLQEAR